MFRHTMARWASKSSHHKVVYRSMTRSESGVFEGTQPVHVANKYRGERAYSKFPWFHIQYETDPGPVNILSNPHASMTFDPAHPVYHMNLKRIGEFDPRQFNFAVTVQTSLHKKPTIRHGVKRRFKQALADYLRELGWDVLGQPQKKAANEHLHGALLLKIGAEDPWAARELPWPEVQALSKWALDTFMKARNENDTSTGSTEEQAAALRKKLADERARIRDKAFNRPWNGSQRPMGSQFRKPDDYTSADAPSAVQTRRSGRGRDRTVTLSPPVRFSKGPDGKQIPREFDPAMIRRQVS
jgi:hypothetical protein